VPEPAGQLVPGGEERWVAFRPEDVHALLGRMDAPWWVAGGWAVDLFLGHQTREHADIEIAVLREDQLVLQRTLAGWDLRIADLGSLTEWGRGVPLPSDKHGIWGREPGLRDAWQLEITLERSERERWIYRRDERVGLSLADLGMRDALGIPYLTPEVVLLYKSKSPRPRDDADLHHVLAHMRVAQRRWLADAIATIDPEHRWLEELAG
jgi:aminoglycoside-2''-adenylyltransferase